MSPLQALIFDVDGTLADTELDGHRVAFNRAFVEAGLDWEWTIDRYSGLLKTAGGKERLQRYIQEDHPDFVPLPDANTWATIMHNTKSEHYKMLIRQGAMPLRPGVKRLIQEARQEGVRLAIATTSALESVIALLESSLAPKSPAWFEVIAAGNMVPAKKPAPDVYLYVLQKMGLPPEECLAIEDSRQGLLAATAAGLKTVMTRSSYTQRDQATEAVLVLNHLGEPDLPFQVSSGHVGSATYLDLALAATLLGEP